MLKNELPLINYTMFGLINQRTIRCVVLNFSTPPFIYAYLKLTVPRLCVYLY